MAAGHLVRYLGRSPWRERTNTASGTHFLQYLPGTEGYKVSIQQIPLITVITPFYNSEDTLTRCIESVLSQRFSDFEYILADNSSTDHSSDIALFYAAKDPRIRYRRFAEFVSQRENYNRALQQFSDNAPYLKIVQADDSLYPDCLEVMARLAKRHPSAGVISGVRSIDGWLDPPNANSLSEFMRGRNIARATILGTVYAFGSPTTVMYRGDLVRRSPEFFRKGAFFDDTDAILELMTQSDFAFSQEQLTHTTRDPVSILGRVISYDISLLYRFITVHRIGTAFFSSNEVARLRDHLTKSYYDQLVKALIRRRDRWKYLAFHRSVLMDSAAMRISLGNVFVSLVRNLARRWNRSFRYRRRQWHLFLFPQV